MKQLTLDGYTNYIIYTNGKVWSNKSKKFMSEYDNGLGYKQVKLTNSITKKRRTFQVHRLVAITYLTNLKELSDVNHKDGNKSNNHISNLEWTSRHENMKHAFDNKLLKGFIKKHY